MIVKISCVCIAECLRRQFGSQGWPIGDVNLLQRQELLSYIVILVLTKCLFKSFLDGPLSKTPPGVSLRPLQQGQSLLVLFEVWNPGCLKKPCEGYSSIKVSVCLDFRTTFDAQTMGPIPIPVKSVVIL